jgi:fatty acid desaturase
MGSSVLNGSTQRTLQDPKLKERLQDLRRTDNWTNWFFIARTYLFLACAIAGAIAFDFYRQAAGWPVAWNIPVFLLAIVLVGAGQHQLSGLAHEGVHHILFRNRWLNELCSDLFCMFPLFSSTYHYRLQHLAHHQFVNDPVRDPDISQLQTSGHWLNFPVTKKKFILSLVKQFWLPNLVRFIRVRAAYNSTGTDKNPYLRKGEKPSKVGVRIGVAYLLGLAALLTALVYLGDPLWLALAPLGLWALVMALYARLPATKFHGSRVHPVIAQRWMVMLRVSYISLVFVALAWLTHLTGRQAALYYFFLWIVPLLTSFSFFMILRQTVQHGNADRGWLTNTRTFFVHDLIDFAVFPIGQGLHLPHHLFATVPHFRLGRLHQELLAYPEYQVEAQQVHGYFLPPHQPQQYPTVLDVLGPDYAPHEFHGVHIDNTVLEDCQVEEKAAILHEGEQEAKRVAQAGGN